MFFDPTFSPSVRPSSSALFFFFFFSSFLSRPRVPLLPAFHLVVSALDAKFRLSRESLFLDVALGGRHEIVDVDVF